MPEANARPATAAAAAASDVISATAVTTVTSATSAHAVAVATTAPQATAAATAAAGPAAAADYDRSTAASSHAADSAVATAATTAAVAAAPIAGRRKRFIQEYVYTARDEAKDVLFISTRVTIVKREARSSAGRRACRRVCWGGAGECSCGAPAMARHLPARVWRAVARGLITPSCHRMKASAGSTRPTQSPSQTPQGGSSTGGKQHRGETSHGETHPPTPPPPRVLQKRVAVQ